MKPLYNFLIKTVQVVFDIVRVFGCETTDLTVQDNPNALSPKTAIVIYTSMQFNYVLQIFSLESKELVLTV